MRSVSREIVIQLLCIAFNSFQLQLKGNSGNLEMSKCISVHGKVHSSAQQCTAGCRGGKLSGGEQECLPGYSVCGHSALSAVIVSALPIPVLTLLAVSLSALPLSVLTLLAVTLSAVTFSPALPRSTHSLHCSLVYTLTPHPPPHCFTKTQNQFYFCEEVPRCVRYFSNRLHEAFFQGNRLHALVCMVRQTHNTDLL